MLGKIPHLIVVITYLLLGKPATFYHIRGKGFAVAVYGNNRAAGIYSKALFLVIEIESGRSAVDRHRDYRSKMAVRKICILI